MKVMQFDVASAFLNGDINEEIYMHQPIGFEDKTNRVCRLNRSLYSLKQALRCWNQKFDQFMVNLGFVQSREDPCVYIRHHKVIVALYVDDGLAVSTNQEELDNLINELRSKFKIVAKELNYFLGLEITQSKIGDISLSQAAFVNKLLERFNMVGCKPVSRILIKRKLMELKLKEGGDIRKHIAFLDKLLQELKTAGEKLTDLDKVNYLLVTLPKYCDADVKGFDLVDKK